MFVQASHTVEQLISCISNHRHHPTPLGINLYTYLWSQIASEVLTRLAITPNAILLQSQWLHERLPGTTLTLLMYACSCLLPESDQHGGRSRDSGTDAVNW
jgi:hypothetical protein